MSRPTYGELVSALRELVDWCEGNVAYFGDEDHESESVAAVAHGTVEAAEQPPQPHAGGETCAACTWDTDGVVVWCLGCGHAIGAARNLGEREGTLAAVPDVAQQRRNMHLFAAAPDLARSLAAVLDAFARCVGPEAWPEFTGCSRHFPDARNDAVVTAQKLLERIPQ